MLKLKKNSNTIKNYKWVTNGIEEKLIDINQEVESGGVSGRLSTSKEVKLKISETLKENGHKPNVEPGFKWYTNGTINKKIYNSSTVPENFVPGRSFDTTKTRSKNFLNSNLFRDININDYISFFSCHSRDETREKFNISLSNHKKLCRYYHIRKSKKGEITCSVE